MHWHVNLAHFRHTRIVQIPNQLAKSLGLTSFVGSHLKGCFLDSALFYFLYNQLFNQIIFITNCITNCLTKLYLNRPSELGFSECYYSNIFRKTFV